MSVASSWRNYESKKKTKTKTKTQTRKFLYSFLDFLTDLLCTWITSRVKEKSKNLKNAVYVVSIFIFFHGWLHISKS